MTTQPAETSPHRIVLTQPDIDGGYVQYTRNGQPLRATARLKALTAGLPGVDGPAAELFLAAMAAWIADRSIRREAQPDRWSRAIEIAFPVADPLNWPAREVERLLRFLSNDQWHVAPYQATKLSTLSPSQMSLLPMEATAVDLFSGGLDSYAHAVSQTNSNPVSVGHWDMETLKGLQDRLHAELGRASFTHRTFHIAVQSSLEDTSRTRGFLFAAAAIAVASALGVRLVTVPENGFVALNVPLTSARLGALSTRSTHPHTLALLAEAVTALGIEIGLDNPWLYSTKGQISCAALPNMKGLATTVSCSHPNAERWQGNASYSNCGYCYPCLVRRSGIEAANDGEDPTIYRHDPRTEAEITAPTTKRRADVYAVVARLATPPHPRDLIRTGPIPRDVDLDRIQDMRQRSHAELRAMLDNGMTRQVRRNLGLG